ncbi:hypothetical protein PCIT_a2760 [Pseudoalteromonas citrea]|uniref:Uncharacterized protein n=1 Tax=Pseudoalteromonas citrea TaxID=43655 RepID=A0AAD4AHV0_9GAMM|nr:hypothetical protein PCIT_a2760 [Pseudoalteromonas citrea]
MFIGIYAKTLLYFKEHSWQSLANNQRNITLGEINVMVGIL